MHSEKFTLIYEKIKNGLKDKIEVSLPEIQAKYSLSYPDAKLVISKLKTDLVIIGEPCGMKYTVNPDIMEKRSLSDTEAAYYRSQLQDDEVAVLVVLNNVVLNKEDNIKKCQRLAELGLAAERGGRFYHTVDSHSVKLISSFKTNGEEWFEITAAIELACAMKTSCADFKPKDLTVLPDSISERISDFLSLPSLQIPQCRMKYTMGKYMLIESFILGNSFTDVEGYRKKISDELCALEAIGLNEGVLVSTVRECVSEFSELTYSNIEEIRKMLSD